MVRQNSCIHAADSLTMSFDYDFWGGGSGKIDRKINE